MLKNFFFSSGKRAHDFSVTTRAKMLVRCVISCSLSVTEICGFWNIKDPCKGLHLP